MVQAIKNQEFEVNINDITLKSLFITNCTYDNDNSVLVLDTSTGDILRINIDDIMDGQVLLKS